MTPFVPAWHCKFNANSKWKDSSDAVVTIVSVDAYDMSTERIQLSDYCVTYKASNGRTYQKDAWNFQVRYTPV